MKLALYKKCGVFYYSVTLHTLLTKLVSSSLSIRHRVPQIFSSGFTVFCNGLLLVDHKLQHVGARIVPDGVVLHFAGRRKRHVELGVYHRLLVLDRLREIVAVGIDDAASAAADHIRLTCDGVLFVEV